MFTCSETENPLVNRTGTIEADIDSQLEMASVQYEGYQLKHFSIIIAIKHDDGREGGLVPVH